MDRQGNFVMIYSKGAIFIYGPGAKILVGGVMIFFIIQWEGVMIGSDRGVMIFSWNEGHL